MHDKYDSVAKQFQKLHLESFTKNLDNCQKLIHKCRFIKIPLFLIIDTDDLQDHKAECLDPE